MQPEVPDIVSQLQQFNGFINKHRLARVETTVPILQHCLNDQWWSNDNRSGAVNKVEHVGKKHKVNKTLNTQDL